MNRVIHFEINADDPNRASEFYSAVFGWKIAKWEGTDYWLAKTGENSPGIDGGIIPRSNGWAIVNTVEVESLKKSIEKIQAAGGSIVSENMSIPGVGYFIYCKDTEGNVFGILQNDENAE